MTLHEIVGAGAHSTVYRATLDDATFTVKVYQAGGDSESAERSFRREAAIHASFRHPAIPAIHEVGIREDRPYIVSDYVVGRTVANVLEQGPLGRIAAVRIARAVADALAEVHRHGIVHRDVKPANILLSETGEIKLIDFGLAGVADTTPDAGAGTFRYSAPEQIGLVERTVDGRADLYSLGVVLFECLTGSPPFTTDNLSELFHQHAAVEPPRVDSLDPGSGPILASIVARLLAKDPDERYRSAEALRQDLDDLGTLEEVARTGGTPVLAGMRRRAARGTFVGRDAELGRLQDAARSAIGGEGRFALVEGAPGTGKSRLIEELVAGHVASSVLWLHGRCRQNDPYPFSSIRDAIDAWVDDIRGPGNAAWLAAARAAAEEVGPVLAQLHPRLAELVGIERPSAPPSDSADLFQNAFGALIRALADRVGGLVLWLDDVQWADQATVETLGALAPTLAGHPALVLLSGRADDESTGVMDQVRAAIGRAQVTRVQLGPLDPWALHDIVRDMLGAPEVDDAFVREVGDRSQGNPLVVWQYVQAMKDAGILLPHWGTWVVDSGGMASLELPTEIYELMTRRLGWLAPATRDVLTAAALIGSRFDAGLLAEVLGGRTRAQVHEALGEALEARLIERMAHGDELGFVHDRVREALLAGSTLDRIGIHARCADWYDRQPDLPGRDRFERARHAMIGWLDGRGRDVFRVCLDAARVANAEYAWARGYELLAFCGRVVDVTTLSAGDQLSWNESLGRAAFATGRMDEAKDHLRAALAHTGEPIRRAALRGGIVRATIFSFDTKAGLQELALAYDELGEPLPSNGATDPAALRTRLVGLMGEHMAVVASDQGYGSAVGQERDRARVLVDLADAGFLIGYYDRNPLVAMQGGILGLLPSWSLGDEPEACRGFSTFAMVLGLIGQREGALRFAELSMRIARSCGDRPALASTQSNAAIARHFAGDADEALVLQREVFDRYAHWLSPLDFQNCCIDLAFNLWTRGYAEEELAVSTAAVRRLEASEGAFLGAYVCRASASVLAAASVLGDSSRIAPAAATVERHRAIVPPTRTIPWVSVEGYLVHAAAQAEDFGESFESAVARHRAWGIPPERGALHAKHFYVAHMYARLELASRTPLAEAPARLADFVAAVAELEAAASPVPTLQAHAHVGRANAHLFAGELAAARASLDVAERLAEDFHNPWALAKVAVTRARLHTRLGHRETASAQATTARQLAWRHGWRRLARRVDGEFQSAGTSTVPGSRRAAALHHNTLDRSSLARLRVQLDGILAISRATAMVLDPDAQARIALDEIIQIMGAERAFLFIQEDEAGWMRFARGRNARREDIAEPSAYSRSIIDRVQSTARAVVLSTRSDAQHLQAESVVAHDLRSVLAAPLMSGDRVLGVVYLDNRLAHGVFTEDHVEILHALASHIGTALQTARAAQLEARLKAETERRRLADTLREIVTSLTSTLNLRESLESLLDAVAREVLYDRALVSVREGASYSVQAVRGWTEGDAGAFLARPSVEAAVATLQRAAAVPVGSVHRPSMAIVLPLQARDAEIGYVILVRDGGVSPNEVDLAAMLVAQAGVAIENARLFRRVRTLAERDDLTRLLNRGEFFRRADGLHQDCRLQGLPLAAVMFDVDHFKRVNDRFGHATGDDVLRVVARAAEGAIRTQDVLARYGGEEFAVLLPGATLEQAREVGERIRRAIANCVVSTPDAHELRVTVSVGATVRAPHEDLAGLLNRADKALYLSKTGGRDRVSILESPTS